MLARPLKFLCITCLAGLLNVLADIYSLLDPYMNASIDMLRANVKDVIAAPKPTAAPPPPAAAPAKRPAPPPPPPKGMYSLCSILIITMGNICIDMPDCLSPGMSDMSASRILEDSYDGTNGHFRVSKPR